jgi:TctA family transporter
MDQYVAALTQGLLAVFTWPTFGYLMVGIVVGMVLGILPGLSGLQGLVLLLPFTFDLAPTEAMALLLGNYAVSTMTDTIPAVLIGVPGSSAAQATVLDGHPMAKKGEAGRALAASYMANIMGAMWAGLVFILAIPIVTPLLMAFGIPEFFMLALLGLAMVGVLSGRSVLKGVIMAGVGLLVSMVGLATHTGQPRYTFDVLYLWSGVPLVPAVLGLFALPELVDMAVRRSAISAVDADPYNGTREGVKDAFRHWAMVARCSLLGAWVGFLPAMGGPVAEWFGYGHAVQSAKDKANFGRGDVRGVLGPEAATSGQKPGALIPTVAFAIPGNVSMAILLGAFLIVGIRPGVDMLTTQLPLTFSLMWLIVVAQFISAALTLIASRQLVGLTLIER